jgi:Na+-transporting NADH:ubiquinone oxidoreductase subunit B
MNQRGWSKLVRQLLARTFTSGAGSETVASSTLFLRTPWTSNWIFVSFIIASIPAGLVSMWLAGDRVLQQLTLLLVALVVAAAWELLFARGRRRAPESTWLMTAWLFTLLLPPSTSPWLAALALSFGVVVGVHIFGGTGKYLVSPALLGVLFLHFSYPGVIPSALPLMGFDVSISWLLACALGAVYLSYTGAISWRVLAGAVLGVVIASGASITLAEDNAAAGLSWYEHLALGNFAFVLAFVATDPNAAPLTRLSRWLYGAAIGLLTVTIRVLDPSHPDGILFAVLLAALSVPLLDYLTLRRYTSPKPGGAL